MRQGSERGVWASFIPWGNLFRQVGCGSSMEELLRMRLGGKNHWVVKGESERQFDTLMSGCELERFETAKRLGEKID